MSIETLARKMYSVPESQSGVRSLIETISKSVLVPGYSISNAKRFDAGTTFQRAKNYAFYIGSELLIKGAVGYQVYKIINSDGV